jgi:hypothetical protein
MKWKDVIEFLVSDIITASIISAIFMVVSNRHADKNEEQNDQNLQQLKDHMDLRLEIIEQKLENTIIKNKSD